jgi:hypothetical protein
MDIANEEMQRLNNLINANMLPGESKGDAFKRLTAPIKPSVSKSNFSAGLVAMKTLSNEWREGATNATAPPQDATDYPKHDIAETLLNCADELDRLIEEMSN